MARPREFEEDAVLNAATNCFGERGFEAMAAGRCVGVAQWIRLDFDQTVSYDNRPTEAAGSNGWMHVIHRFARPVDVSAGTVAPLALSHNRTNIAIGLDE